jgi:hypothetical protein
VFLYVGADADVSVGVDVVGFDGVCRLGCKRGRMDVCVGECGCA